MERRSLRLLTLLIAVPAAVPGPALAHAREGLQGGLVSGFLHPVVGPDHLVAMVAVGLWGAQLRAPAIWLLPITFPALMAVGGLFGILGLPLPFVEAGVSLSAIVLGLLVALAAGLPLPGALTILAGFTTAAAFTLVQQFGGGSIAVRAAGSWISAVGILMVGLQVAG